MVPTLRVVSPPPEHEPGVVAAAVYSGGRRVAPDDETLARTVQAVLRSGDTGLGLMVAEIVYQVRAPALCPQLYEWLCTEERHNVLWTMHGMAAFGPVARPLMLLAATMGRLDAARLIMTPTPEPISFDIVMPLLANRCEVKERG